MDLPPIYRDAKRLVILVEQVVKQFPRYHRYTLGTDLRQQAMKLLRLVHKAWRDKANQAKQLSSLVWAIDDFRLSLQMAKELQAFRSFAQFEQLAQIVRQLGKQCGGWLKAVVNHGQNSQGSGVEKRQAVGESAV